MDDDTLAMWRAIEAAPADDLPKLIAADFFDERGMAEGAALRWLVNTGRQPRRWFLGYRRYSWSVAPEERVLHTAWLIPRRLGAYLDPARYMAYRTQARGPRYDYRSRYTAELDLVITWRMIADMGLDPLAEPGSPALRPALTPR